MHSILQLLPSVATPPPAEALPLAGLRLLGPLALTVLAVLVIDRGAERRGLQLPGFLPSAVPGWQLRRAAALSLLGIALYLGVFGPLGALGRGGELDLAGVSPAQLFVLHGIFVVALAGYLLLGMATVPADSLRRGWRAELGLVAASPARELGLGLLAGVVAWAAVIVLLTLIAAVVLAVGGRAALPDAPPTMIVFVAGLPWWVRVALSISAGVVEEALFRGLLQPRIGIVASTVLFVLAHAAYEQPFLLIGVTALSFAFAALTRWRKTIWPAVAAHAAFDAIQLLVLIPIALDAVADGSG